MTSNTLSQSRLKELIHYCPETGLLTRLVSNTNSIKVGSTAGNKDSAGYLRLNIDYRNYKAHRLAWLYVYGVLPEFIDHINGIKSDNRLVNLREVTTQENSRNTKIHKNNKSGVVGVSWCSHARKWRSSMKVDGNTLALGYFEHIFPAACTRKSAELKYNFHPNHGRRA